MVGVAGKSQACNTCRKRRVKCDYTRPYCRKCTASDRVCTGYERDLIFVNRTPSNPSSTATSVLSELRAQQQLEESLAHPTSETDLRSLFSKTAQNCHDFRVYAVGLLKTIYLPQHALFSNFDTVDNGASWSWVYLLSDLTKSSQSLDASLFALCLVQLHITGAGGVSLEQCLDQYNAALQYLCYDLADPDQRFREETLAAILAVSTCELYICPTEDGWVAHAHGIADILRLRDPALTSTRTWQYLFSRMRILCTIQGVARRQDYFFENDIWRYTSAKFSNTNTLDTVFHLAVGVPTLLQQITTLASINDQTTLRTRSLAMMQSILSIVKSYELWLFEYWKASPTPRAWLRPSCATNLADGDPSNKVFPYCFEFESLLVAAPMLMSWSIMVHLYSEAIQVYNFVQAKLGHCADHDLLLRSSNINTVITISALESSNHEQMLRSTYRIYSIQDVRDEAAKLARYVCQSMEYYHRIDMGTIGNQTTTWPSWTARQFFRLHPGYEREYWWSQNMRHMEGPGTRWGLSMMTFRDIAGPLGGV